MTEVLLHSPSPPSSSSSSSNEEQNPLFQFVNEREEQSEEGISRVVVSDDGDEAEEQEVKDSNREGDRRDQLSLLALLLTLFRKSFWATACKAEENKGQELSGMEIGWPTNVRHVAHVTFDRFNGFLGLPVEFEPEVPRRAPSASATVFGVSTESMQLAYDIRGNSIPTILLLMQRHLYAQGGLQAEGIFRITADNSQEEHVRNQLNRGVVPDGIDVHCLSGLIKKGHWFRQTFGELLSTLENRNNEEALMRHKEKEKAWFRELPSGVLDPLSPEQVMQCQSEDDCSALVRLLPPTETALLDWAINLMADVVQQEHVNKMNAHNIAMVFAPNMTQMADPLTALMYAVQVMNFLKTLITKTLREREESVIEPAPICHLEPPPDENGHQGPSQSCLKDDAAEDTGGDRKQTFTAQDPPLDSDSDSNEVGNATDEEYHSYSESDGGYGETHTQAHAVTNVAEASVVTNAPKSWAVESKLGQSSDSNLFKGCPGGMINGPHQLVVQSMGSADKSKGISNLSRINSRTERIEAWR